LLFILWLVTVHSEYYAQDVYVLSDVIEGILGYTFLIAMVVTSFKFGRKWLNSRQWKALHKLSIYFLWAYAWSVYWFELFYYEAAAQPIDYIYYWAGLFACLLRIAAWATKRAAGHELTAGVVCGGIIIVVSLLAATFGAGWSQLVYAAYAGNGPIEAVESIVPYFPFVPFFPLVLILLGAYLWSAPPMSRA
jgi:hypothetical protein